MAGWQTEIAAKAQGNDLLMMVISLAFAGPLIRPLGLEGGGFHFRGPSSCGKTSLALAAGSVWGGGGPLGAGHSWRATANALEMIAFGHSETLLVLDELALVAPEEAGQAAYALATGQGKARSKTDGALRRRSEWRALLLSTGEIGLADHIRASRRGERAMAGQELRLLDVAADAGAGLGVWQSLHGAAGAAEFADDLKARCHDHYGHAGPAFVEGYLRDRELVKSFASAELKRFMSEAQLKGDTGQVHRAALRFGLVAAAGEVATLVGVVPWAEGEAFTAALAVFGRWASAFGRNAPREDQDIIRTVKGAIEAQLSRFAILGTDAPAQEWETPAPDRAGEARSLMTLGYRQLIDNQVRYLIHDAGWAEILKGHDLTYAAKILHAAGYLEPGDGSHLRKKVRVQGQGRRFYAVKSELLSAEINE